MRKLLLIGCAVGVLGFSGCSLDALMGRSDDLYAQSRELAEHMTGLKEDLSNWQDLDAAEKGAIVEKVEGTAKAVADINDKAPSKGEAAIAIVSGVVLALWGNTALGRIFRVFMAGRAVRREESDA